MNDHSFCRALLSLARETAKEHGVELPKGLTALKSSRDLYFIESRKDNPREFVKGDCCYSAKAEFIGQLIERKTGKAVTAGAQFTKLMEEGA